MGHRLDIGDVLDVLEESKLKHSMVHVELRDGRVFDDRVTDIGPWDGEDQVAFVDHEMVPVRRISNISRATPVAHDYAPKH